MNDFIKSNEYRCNNHRCHKRNRCCRYLQLRIDTEDFKKENESKSILMVRYEENNCEKFIEFDDNN